jgi:hypothetical protein
MGLFDKQFRIVQHYPEGQTHPTRYRYAIEQKHVFWWDVVSSYALHENGVEKDEDGYRRAQDDGLEVVNAKLDTILAAIRERREKAAMLKGFKKKVVRYARI